MKIGNCELRADTCGVSLRIGKREWFWDRDMRRLSCETVDGSRRIRLHWTWDRNGLQPKPAEFWRKDGCTYLRIGRREWAWLLGDSPRHPRAVLRKVREAIFRGQI